MNQSFSDVLAREIDKIVLADASEVESLGGTMADLNRLMMLYGPDTTIGAARDLEMERIAREGRA